jgi:hypothetical protein
MGKAGMTRPFRGEVDLPRCSLRHMHLPSQTPKLHPNITRATSGLQVFRGKGKVLCPSQPKISTALRRLILHPRLQASTVRRPTHHSPPKISIAQDQIYNDRSQQGTSHPNRDLHNPRKTFTALRGRISPSSRVQSWELRNQLMFNHPRIRSFDR